MLRAYFHLPHAQTRQYPFALAHNHHGGAYEFTTLPELRVAAERQLQTSELAVVRAGVRECWSFIGALAIILNIHVDTIWNDIISMILEDANLREEMVNVENVRRHMLQLTPLNDDEYVEAFSHGNIGLCDALIRRFAAHVPCQIVVIELVSYVTAREVLLLDGPVVSFGSAKLEPVILLMHVSTRRCTCACC